MFLNCGTSLLVVIRMIAFELQSVNIDLFLDLFIFIQENAWSQMYVDPNSDKSLAAKLLWKFQKYSENSKQRKLTLT